MKYKQGWSTHTPLIISFKPVLKYDVPTHNYYDCAKFTSFRYMYFVCGIIHHDLKGIFRPEYILPHESTNCGEGIHCEALPLTVHG